ncbi:MAG: hypothetical protein DRO15_01265 [Thermoprotei archaeon]|nr:MAG: hypothetical protein DRO15_01265 [Thermoprotei archaeon]
MSNELELEFLGSYRVLGLGEKRWKFRVKNSNIYINVSAPTFEEAVKKAIRIARKIRKKG